MLLLWTCGWKGLFLASAELMAGHVFSWKLVNLKNHLVSLCDKMTQVLISSNLQLCVGCINVIICQLKGSRSYSDRVMTKISWKQRYRSLKNAVYRRVKWIFLEEVTPKINLKEWVEINQAKKAVSAWGWQEEEDIKMRNWMVSQIELWEIYC